MNKLTRFAALMIISTLTLTGSALATERPSPPECFSDPGICFSELDEVTFCAFGVTSGGDFWRFCLVGDENDYIKITPNGKFFQHAVEAHAIYVDACPAMLSGAACADLPPLHPDVDFQSGFDGVTGFGRITFNTVSPCTVSIHGAGSVQNSAGESFDLRLNNVEHPGPGGCVIVMDDLKISPAQP